MGKWKRIIDEIPKEKELVIIKSCDGIIECVQYVKKNYWEEVGTGCQSFYDFQIEAWCRIPKFDLNK